MHEQPAGDAIDSHQYVMNPEIECRNAVGVNTSYIFDGAAGSFRPGGANFAFCDGSVHFLEDSINTSPYSQTNCQITHIGGSTGNAYWLSAPGQTSIGVYQALATRAGGEVISSDSD